MPLDRPSHQPFPVTKGRYDMRPGMREFGRAAFGMPAEFGHFRLDQTTPRYVQAKLNSRARYPDSALRLADSVDAERVTQVVWRTLRTLGEEEPSWLEWSEDQIILPLLGVQVDRTDALELRTHPAPLEDLGRAIADQCQRQTGVRRWLELLGLVVPCDFAMMASASEGHHVGDQCEAMHVCFPSSWSPRMKVGRDFAEIHRPVANNEKILKGSANLVHAMCFMGPYVRYAWGMHRHGGLDSNPDHQPERIDMTGWSPERVAAQTWLRVERQTTKPFPDLARGLFTIRTFVEPLVEVAKDREKAQQLAAAIRSMNPASLRYKGLIDRGEALLAYLDG